MPISVWLNENLLHEFAFKSKLELCKFASFISLLNYCGWNCSKLAKQDSEKAIFIREQALLSCNIWFICKGNLICTR